MALRSYLLPYDPRVAVLALLIVTTLTLMSCGGTALNRYRVDRRPVFLLPLRRPQLALGDAAEVSSRYSLFR